MFQKEIKVGKKGQVTIPKAIRTALKIEPGSKVRLTLENNRVMMEPVR